MNDALSGNCEPTAVPPRFKKHVWNLGRFRIATRLGRYRFGYHHGTIGAWSAGLGFAWVSVTRRRSA
jgi:hypothetical protein